MFSSVLFLLAFGSFCTLIQPTEDVGWSQQWTSLDVVTLTNLEAIRDGQLCFPMLVLSSLINACGCCRQLLFPLSNLDCGSGGCLSYS